MQDFLYGVLGKSATNCFLGSRKVIIYIIKDGIHYYLAFKSNKNWFYNERQKRNVEQSLLTSMVT